MKSQRAKSLRILLLVSVAALFAPAGALGTTLHFTLLDKNGMGSIPPGFTRSADGTLHVAFETNTSWGNSANGIGTISISPSGHVGALVQALNWNAGASSGIPGLAVMPGGALEAVVGGSP